MDEKEKKSNKIEALWDCPYCGQKGIGGLKKHCPNCSHPQDDGTRFYMPTEISYMDEETAEKYGQGEDWDCPYCGSMNRYDAEFCTNCGAPREESKSTYSNREEKRDYEAEELKRQADEQRKEAQQKRREEIATAQKKRRRVLIPILLALVALLVFTFMPKNSTASVAAKQWQRAISIEQYTTVQQSDWTLPAGAREYGRQEELHHYQQVLDHYEDVQVQRSRTVQDGYDTETSYRDNGDGTYTEVTQQVPRYVTEYYYETVQQPVYRNEPVYAVKYYYEIDRWLPSRTASSSGTTDAPYWADPQLSESERESGRSAAYAITLQTDKNGSYTIRVTEDMFNALTVGDKVEIVVSAGAVQSVNGTPVY